jgi:hypothetical protein
MAGRSEEGRLEIERQPAAGPRHGGNGSRSNEDGVPIWYRSSGLSAKRWHSPLHAGPNEFERSRLRGLGFCWFNFNFTPQALSTSAASVDYVITYDDGAHIIPIYVTSMGVCALTHNAGNMVPPNCGGL